MEWMDLVEHMKNYMIYLVMLHDKDPVKAEEVAKKGLLATGMWTKESGFHGIEELNNDRTESG